MQAIVLTEEDSCQLAANVCNEGAECELLPAKNVREQFFLVFIYHLDLPTYRPNAHCPHDIATKRNF